jgi:hypothetical protein
VFVEFTGWNESGIEQNERKNDWNGKKTRSNAGKIVLFFVLKTWTFQFYIEISQLAVCLSACGIWRNICFSDIL